MSNYFPNAAEVLCLQAVIDNELDNATLHLFKSNHANNQADTAATYNAIECTFGGYAAITLNSWSAAATNAGNKAETSETIRTFTATGAGLPESIYGVYILDSGGDLVFAELLDSGAFTLNAAGQVFNYLPVVTLFTA